MAAIYSGIHLKLKNPRTAWEDKLKLARFAWISSQCLLPNKEQVLFDWCTHALTGWYSQKVDFSQSVLEGLWRYLDDLLHSQKLHALLKQGKTISLRLNVAQLLLDRLQEFSHPSSKPAVCASTVLSVCQAAVSSPVLSSVFITKYELMVQLLLKLCSMASIHLQQALSATSPPVASTNSLNAIKSSSTPDKLNSSQLFELLPQVLSFYLAVQRQQANPHRVFTILTNQILQPLVLLRHLLTSADHSHTHPGLRQQLRRDICAKTDSILLSALFPPELLTSYKEELLPSKSDTGKRGAGGAKGPLKPVTAIFSKLTAEDYCEPALLYPVKSNTLSLLFKFFLDSYGKRSGQNEEEQRMMCFYFLTRIVPALDLGLDGHLVSPAEADESLSAPPVEKPPTASLYSPQMWSLSLQVVESLLSQALSADIYNVAADKIRHEGVQLHFYRALGQILFNQAQPSIPAWYHCLKVLLGLNHLILEPDLDQLLSSAWVNSECMDTAVQQARKFLVRSLLQIYTKLRQVPRLFSELLSVICQPALEELRPPLLFDGFSTTLSLCLLEMPQSQGLEICSLVLDSMRRCILPGLARMEKMETDGGQGENGDLNLDQERRDASLKLLSLSQLLHTALFNLKTIDNASPLPLVKQGQALMKQLQQMVRDLVELLSAETNLNSGQKTTKKRKKSVSHKEPEEIPLWEQNTQEATLLLRYTWVEVDVLFELYCQKYTSFKAEDENLSSASDMIPMDSLVHGNIFRARMSPSPTSSPLGCFLYKLLTLQQVKKLLHSSSSTGDSNSAALLRTAVQFVLNGLKLQVRPGGEQVWDEQISSIKASSYSVAVWYLITTHVPLIHPYLSQEDIKSFADVLVSSLPNRQTDELVDRPPSFLTVPLISLQLLQSPILPELPSLFSATVCSLRQRIGDVLLKAQEHQACANESSQLLSKLLKNENIVEDMLVASNTGEVFVLLTDAQIEKLTSFVQILMELNPDAMNPEDLSSVFLLLVFMLSSSSHQSSPVLVDSPDSAVNVSFLVHLLRILTRLLESINIKGVLKIVYGGPLLQAVMLPILWHSKRGRFAATPSSDWLNLIKAVQDFIGSLVKVILVRKSVHLNLDQFVSFLTCKVWPDPGASIQSVHLQLASLSSLALPLTSHLGKSEKRDHTLTEMISRVAAALRPTVESVLKAEAASTSVLSRTFVAEVLTVLLHCELSTPSVDTTSCMTLCQHLCQQILKDLCCPDRPVDSLVSSLHFLSVFYRAVERKSGAEQGGRTAVEELYVQILQSLCSLLAATWLSSEELCALEATVQELLQRLMENSTTAQLTSLLLTIRDGLNAGKLRTDQYREVLSAVTITKLLYCCHSPEPCCKALWLIAPEVISAMVFLVRSCSHDASLTLPFVVPTLLALTSLLRQGEGVISNPHHVVMVLGALQSVSIDHLTPLGYLSMFKAVHEALFAIIQCHPQVMLSSAPSFLNVFHRLVTSIMHQGRQRGNTETGSEDDVFLQCSRLTQRMYSHIAVTSENFTTLSVFMVAHYVTELQKVTLRPDVKLHLTEGIYQILDLCAEQDIKFLMSILQTGVREVFSELYSSYTHYHKAQRQGEDKYTV